MAEYRSFRWWVAAEELGKMAADSQKRIDPRLLPYTRGTGIRVQGDVRFSPNREGDLAILNDAVGGWSVLVLQGGGKETRILRRFHDGPDLDFALVDGAIQDEQTVSKWDGEGLRVAGPLAGTRLVVPQYARAYWLAWSSFYRDTEVRCEAESIDPIIDDEFYTVDPVPQEDDDTPA